MTTDTIKRDTLRAPEHSKFAEMFSDFRKLSGLLRILGASVLVAAMSVFLLQNWDSGNDINRYLLLLAHTVVLAIVGLVSGHWIRENKGARLFLALALGSVAVNFTILGSLIYSQFHWDIAPTFYPQFATWQADSLHSALITAGASVVLLAPLTFLGFLTLARRSALRLTLMSMLSSAALLLPIRSSETVTAVLVALTIVLIHQLAATTRRDNTLQNAEGRFARIVPLIPLGIMLGRSLYLYSIDAFLIAAGGFITFAVMRQVSLQMDLKSKLRIGIECLSIAPALVTAVSSAWLVSETLLRIGIEHLSAATSFGGSSAWLISETFSNADRYSLPVAGIVFACMVFELSLRSSGGGAGFRRIASIGLAMSVLVNLFVVGGVTTAALCLLVGLTLIIYGGSVQQRVVAGLGLVTLLFGLGFQVSYAIDAFDFGSWGSLALLGTVAIVAGSILERHGINIKTRLTAWRGQLGAWSN